MVAQGIINKNSSENQQVSSSIPQIGGFAFQKVNVKGSNKKDKKVPLHLMDSYPVATGNPQSNENLLAYQS